MCLRFMNMKLTLPNGGNGIESGIIAICKSLVSVRSSLNTRQIYNLNTENATIEQNIIYIIP